MSTAHDNLPPPLTSWPHAESQRGTGWGGKTPIVGSAKWEAKKGLCGLTFTVTVCEGAPLYPKIPRWQGLFQHAAGTREPRKGPLHFAGKSVRGKCQLGPIWKELAAELFVSCFHAEEGAEILHH